jgi:hypothetical protein
LVLFLANIYDNVTKGTSNSARAGKDLIDQINSDMISNKHAHSHLTLTIPVVLILIFAAVLSCTSEGENASTDSGTEKASNPISNTTPSNAGDDASNAALDATTDASSHDASSSKSKAPSSIDQLFEEYYETPSMVRPRTASGQNLEIWKKAIQAFSDKDYHVALAKYSKLANTAGFVQKSEVTFYAGICQMELEEYDDAVTTFESISSKSTYSLDTKWYLSLAYLKTNQMELAKVFLTEIRDASGYKAAPAEMILLKTEEK